MFKKGDVVEVTSIDERKNLECYKYLGEHLKVKAVTSRVWRHNIQLELIGDVEGVESFLDQKFLERHGWNKDELTKVE